eukprot:423415-Rhodomonas_salina.3
MVVAYEPGLSVSTDCTVLTRRLYTWQYRVYLPAHGPRRTSDCTPGTTHADSVPHSRIPRTGQLHTTHWSSYHVACAVLHTC